MNCRDIESLILAERDGVLTKNRLAALSDHVASCPACHRLRTGLKVALDTLKADVAAVAVPDADEAWRDLRVRLHKPARKRPLAPVIWFGVSLAAAAAIAMALFLGSRPVSPGAGPSTELAESVAPLPIPLYDPSIIAGADYVETGDPDASVMVYVDKDSGWLVVWATDADAGSKG